MSPHNQLFDQSRFSAKRQQSRLDLKVEKILNVYFNVLHFITLYLLIYLYKCSHFIFYLIKYEKNNIILSLSHIMILFISSIHNWLFYKKKKNWDFLLYYFQIWVFKHYICFPFSWFHVEQPVNNNNTLKNTKSYICMGPIIGRNDILHTKKRSMF